MARAIVTSGQRANPAGGSATAGGVSFQARVTAIAAIALLRGQPLGWLSEVERDIPNELLAETNGPGDDLRLVLRTGAIVEAAESRGCDLIVMVTHGRGAFGEFLFGSHTKAVLAGSRLPLLVLH